jgi:predicted XRE-type DNA-binding protein
MNISKFTEQYNEYLSKINETQDKLLSSMDLEKIKEYKLFLSNIYDEISNLTILIKEKLDQSNITSTLKIQIQELVESIKNKTDNFHKEEILQMISELKELIKNTSLYAEVEPLLKQMEERNKELISKLNETGLADEFTKVLASIKNLENLFKNRTELMEKINTRISQVDLAGLSTRLNLSLTNIKEEIIGIMKNTTELKEKRNELKNNILAQLDQFKNSFNYLIIQVVENIETTVKKNYNSTNLKDILDNLKIEIENKTDIFKSQIEGITGNFGENNTKLNELKEQIFFKINETIYKLQAILQD